MSVVTTVAQAKQYLRDNWEEGIDCPCCGQFVKRYQYSLNVSIGLTLIKMYKLHKQGVEWVHVNTQIKPTSGGYFSLGKWWDLIEQRSKGPEDDKRVSGYWRLTKRGEQFVLGAIDVPKYVEVFDNKRLGFSSDLVQIKQCIGKKFSYSELMYGENSVETMGKTQEGSGL